MRRLALTTLPLLLLLPLAPTQARRAAVAHDAQKCPAVEVTCPTDMRPGEPLTFTASVDAAAADAKYTIKWEVSAGTIASAQGRLSITVDTTGVSAPVAATVEVGGLPAACDRYASCAVTPELFICGHPIDEYGDMAFEDEQARLDNFAIELQNDPAATGYLICYGGRVGHEGDARRRCERAKDYISRVRGIGGERILTADGGFKENLTVVLWVVPSGATPPQPAPTVDPSEVTILKRKPARKRPGR
ncbi:MAG TPA: hypothetical protein VM936_06920 [Pyrinomonadaceae bacterium]|jgi:hypothetical protein|nr:hypothetical protein [Pyrinomonadaceae bacterium]